MSSKELQLELESLRAELASLTKVRAEQREKLPDPGPDPDPIPETDTKADYSQSLPHAAVIDIEDSDAVQGQVDKLMDQLEHEVRDLPAVTTLAVFSLGVLFGRLLH